MSTQCYLERRLRIPRDTRKKFRDDFKRLIGRISHQNMRPDNCEFFKIALSYLEASGASPVRVRLVKRHYTMYHTRNCVDNARDLVCLILSEGTESCTKDFHISLLRAELDEGEITLTELGLSNSEYSILEQIMR